MRRQGECVGQRRLEQGARVEVARLRAHGALCRATADQGDDGRGRRGVRLDGDGRLAAKGGHYLHLHTEGFEPHTDVSLYSQRSTPTSPQRSAHVTQKHSLS